MSAFVVSKCRIEDLEVTRSLAEVKTINRIWSCLSEIRLGRQTCGFR